MDGLPFNHECGSDGHLCEKCEKALSDVCETHNVVEPEECVICFEKKTKFFRYPVENGFQCNHYCCAVCMGQLCSPIEILTPDMKPFMRGLGHCECMDSDEFPCGAMEDTFLNSGTLQSRAYLAVLKVRYAEAMKGHHCFVCRCPMSSQVLSARTIRKFEPLGEDTHPILRAVLTEW